MGSLPLCGRYSKVLVEKCPIWTMNAGDYYRIRSTAKEWAGKANGPANHGASTGMASG
ncbi:hypothetical protein RvVAR0630_33420 [Agrobacterium vitis]|nr:hypothetical protein RvVAR0630_33420 [Agrobacterium vitis]